MRQKFLVIHNKMAGRLKAPMLTSVMKALENRGVDLTLKAAASVEEDVELAKKAARLNEVDAVVAAGGDSTIRGVALGLMGSKMPLGIIPAGTGNVLAQELALGRNPEKIAAALIDGGTKSIKPGLANGAPFLLMAGAGFDAQIVKNLNHSLKQRIRKAAYVWPALKALSAKPELLNIEFDDETDGQKIPQRHQAAFVVVTRARHYGGSFIIAPDADLAADDFQVVMFKTNSRSGLIRALVAAAMGKVANNKSVMIRSCQKVRIGSEKPVYTQIDGEWLETTPLEIGCADQGIELICPAGQD